MYITDTLTECMPTLPDHPGVFWKQKKLPSLLQRSPNVSYKTQFVLISAYTILWANIFIPDFSKYLSTSLFVSFFSMRKKQIQRQTILL